LDKNSNFDCSKIIDFNNGVNFILNYFNYKYIECKYNQ